jgi:glutathione synthase/RimK-type ligase-like ATP-grasp enzyme
MKLSYKSREMFIYGYQFPLNGAVADALCKDKSATYELLKECKIPAIPHLYFTCPEWKHYVGGSDDQQRLNDLLSEYGMLVLKPNEGTGGRDVYFVDRVETVLEAQMKIFKRNDAMAVSPFFQIEDEYRTIVLNDTVKITYKKKRPSVIGDGVKNVALLAHEKYSGLVEVAPSVDLNYVPLAGAEFILSQKHNLGLGGEAQDVDDSVLLQQIEELAIKVAKIITIRFAAVDIVILSGVPYVLEINSGVMAENYGSTSKANYDKIKKIYEEAINEDLKFMM